MDRAGTREFYSDRVVTPDGRDSALIFIERDLLLPLTEADDVNMDGTFATPPTMFAQLATFHLVKFNRVSIINDYLLLHLI